MNKDNVLNTMIQSKDKQARFLAAWKEGVDFLGPELFGPGSPESARSKDELRPLRDAIDSYFTEESGGEEQFLAAMVSFYDPEWGEELAARIECYKSLCGLTYNLDHACVAMLSEMLLNYEGWSVDESSIYVPEVDTP
jgi:hypothetical protein